MSSAGILADAAVVARAKALAATMVDGELVMMDVERGHYVALNGASAQIWEAIAQPMRFDALCSALTRRFAVADDRCRSEVSAFLRAAQAQGLVKLV